MRSIASPAERITPRSDSTRSTWIPPAPGIPAPEPFPLGNSTGSYNTADGGNALIGVTTGSYNTGIGANALGGSLYTILPNTTGNYNTATGFQALEYDTSGSNNTASGSTPSKATPLASAIPLTGRVRFSTTSPVVTTPRVGFSALQSYTGSNNTATGAYALQKTNGFGNTADGVAALQHDTTGGNNTASGDNALKSQQHRLQQHRGRGECA